MVYITTERLIVRRFAAGDLANYLSYQALPEVLQYMPNEPPTEQQAAQFLAQQATLEDGQQGAYHALAIYHRADARVIGDVGFYMQEGPERNADLGFQFHPRYHGQGYAREAAAAVVRLGFAQWNLWRITAMCDVRNTASFRLMECLGMRREAHFVQSRITRGVLHDEYAYALLRDEWLARNAGSANQTATG